MTKKSNNRPLVPKERNQIYNEIIFGLMGMKVYKNEQITVWDLNDPELKRFKIMLKLFRDHGKEFKGEFIIQEMKRKMIYELHNNFAKKSTTYISKYKPVNRIITGINNNLSSNSNGNLNSNPDSNNLNDKK